MDWFMCDYLGIFMDRLLVNLAATCTAKIIINPIVSISNLKHKIDKSKIQIFFFFFFFYFKEYHENIS